MRNRGAHQVSLVLIRHGKTQGNLTHRYIGARTDEPLCAQGIAELKERVYPPVERVFTSPMKRCVQSAALIYPGLEPEIIADLRECDFGEFEGKNYAELNGRADYQAFIDSGGEAPFPGGESRAQFAARCVKAGMRLMELSAVSDCALVAHGGTIMALMEKYARPAGGYFDFQVGTAQGFILEADGRYRPLFSQASGERGGKAAKP